MLAAVGGADCATGITRTTSFAFNRRPSSRHRFPFTCTRFSANSFRKADHDSPDIQSLSPCTRLFWTCSCET
jgi:hypothetical protein